MSTKFVRTRQGEKEVATAYEPRFGGTLIPSAFTDDRGGRDDLTGDTVFTNGLVDPTFLDDTEVQPAMVSKPVPPLPLAPAPPAVVVQPVKEAPVVAPAAAPASMTLEDLQRMLSSLQPQLTPAPAPPPKPTSDSKTFVEVVLSGEFGIFRSKAADVSFCENHIAIVYTSTIGDPDLRFEPPMGAPFDLKVEMANRTWQTTRVFHYGLVTSLPAYEMVVVVFPRVMETKSAEEDA